MSQPFVGEIRMFGGNFPPVGWAFCDGQLLSIAQNDVLFALIGTTYGGDGQSTLALPDLRGRIPVHTGQGAASGFTIGQSGGIEAVTLTVPQTPLHTHPLNASTAAASPTAVPAGSKVAATSATMIYSSSPSGASMSPSAVSIAGGNQPHENMAPFLSVSFIISLFGIFPSQG